MRKTIKTIIALLLLSCTLLSMTSCNSTKSPSESNGDKSSGQDEARTEVLTLMFGSTGSGNEDDPMGYPARKFMELVEEKTNGMIKFEFYPSSQLGSEQEMLDQIMSGTLDSAMISSSVLATVWDELYFYSMPFAFGSIDEFWAICGSENEEFVTAMKDVVDGSGLAHFISTFHTSPRGCQNTVRTIRCADDFEGLAFRVMAGEIYADTFNALGASTATITFTELFSSLQQGVVDGEDLSPFFFYDNKYYEIEKYLTEINMIQNVTPLLFSNATWDKLTDKEKEIIQEAAAEAEKESAANIKRMSADIYEKIEAQGVEVVRYEELTQEEISSFRSAALSVWDKYAERMGEDLFAFLPST